MSAIFPELPQRLGDYTLTRRLSERNTSELYEATQSHVERAVILEVLRPGSPRPILDSFLNTARARVVAALPRVGQVFESLMTDTFWYLAQERPVGQSLAERIAEDKALTPCETCFIISAAAELYTACLKAQLATAPLTADAIFLSADGNVTFLSPVVPGEPTPDSPPTQMRELALTLRPVLPRSGPGKNRVSTLSLWLQEGYEGQWLEWSSIQSTAALILEQLAPPQENRQEAPQEEVQDSRRRTLLKRYRSCLRHGIRAAAALTLISALACLGFLAPAPAPATIPPHQGDYIACQATPEPAALMARPVSLREYRRFLQACDAMKPEQLAALNKNIPAEHTSHRPADWETQEQAAQTQDTPVTGVSYWDALAYARHAGGELPEAGLLTAARREIGTPGIQEWTASTRQNSDMYREAQLILPSGDSPDTAPLLESDRSARHPQRGFRILLPNLPTPSDT